MKILLRAYCLLLGAFMLAPLVLIVWMSFTPNEFFVLPTHEFTLRWYRQIFAHPGFVDAFLQTRRIILVPVEVRADFRGDGEPGGDGQADGGHVGEVGTLAAEQELHGALALG